MNAAPLAGKSGINFLFTFCIPLMLKVKSRVKPRKANNSCKIHLKTECISSFGRLRWILHDLFVDKMEKNVNQLPSQLGIFLQQQPTSSKSSSIPTSHSTTVSSCTATYSWPAVTIGTINTDHRRATTNSATAIGFISDCRNCSWVVNTNETGRITNSAHFRIYNTCQSGGSCVCNCRRATHVSNQADGSKLTQQHW